MSVSFSEAGAEAPAYQSIESARLTAATASPATPRDTWPEASVWGSAVTNQITEPAVTAVRVMTIAASVPKIMRAFMCLSVTSHRENTGPAWRRNVVSGEWRLLPGERRKGVTRLPAVAD